MFLAWMHWADPSFVTGLSDDDDAQFLWHEAFAYFGGERSTDAEFLFVAGTMAGLFSYVLGSETEWRVRGSQMRKLALQLAALPVSAFKNRGEYGKYFAHQLRGALAAKRTAL